MIRKFIDKFKNAPLVLKASIAYTICNILQKSLSLITMPLFTRILTQEQYGQYSVYTSWSAIFTILITLNLAYGSFNNAMLKYEDKRTKYISSTQGLVFLLALVFLAVYLPFSSFFNDLLNMSTPLIILMICEIITQFSLQAWSGLKKYEYKYKGVVAITLVMAVLSPILALVLIFNTPEKGIARILGYAIINILIGGFLLIHNMIKGKNIFSKEFWGFALKFNLPLLIYYFSQVIFNQSDRIMIENMCGLDKAAIYSVAYSLAMILTFVLNAINNSYVPWFYEKIKAKEHTKNKSMSIIITLIMCTLVLGVIWATPEIVLVMSGKEYMDAIWVVPPIAISLILLLYTQFFVNIEFYYENKLKLVLASIASAVVNLVLNYWLIPTYGYFVAGYTTLFSYVLFALCNYFAVFKKVSRNGELYGTFNLKILLGIFALFVGVSYAGVALYNYPIIRYSVIAVGIIVVLVFHKKILELYKKIKNGNKPNEISLDSVSNEVEIDEFSKENN